MFNVAADWLFFAEMIGQEPVSLDIPWIYQLVVMGVNKWHFESKTEWVQELTDA